MPARRAAALLSAESTGALYRRWYEVLAPHFCRDWAASEALLALFRQLWGQPFAAPTYALLLHQWLLVHAEAGGGDQRLKHLNVLCSGALRPHAARAAAAAESGAVELLCACSPISLTCAAALPPFRQAGARQLFLGDVETGRTAFQPLFSFISEQVCLPCSSGARCLVLGGWRRLLPASTSPTLW